MGKNSRNLLGKHSKCSKLIKQSSELSQNVPSCPKMSQNPLQTHHCPNGLVIHFFTQFLTGLQPDLRWTDKVGEIHHARWMAAAIYILKMVICGEERIQMGQRQAKGLLDLAYFIIYVYGRYWFAAPIAADAPFLTLSLWHDLNKWSSRDPQLCSTLIRILDRHTWYLTGRNIFYALFSMNVDNDTKAKIAAAMRLPENEACELPPGKPAFPMVSPESNLEDFVDCETWNLCRVRLLSVNRTAQ